MRMTPRRFLAFNAVAYSLGALVALRWDAWDAFCAAAFLAVLAVVGYAGEAR
jgi:uncharacterized membrane protein